MMTDELYKIIANICLDICNKHACSAKLRKDRWILKYTINETVSCDEKKIKIAKENIGGNNIQIKVNVIKSGEVI